MSMNEKALAKKGVFFFIGKTNAASAQIKEYLRVNGFYCYSTEAADEIDQGGKQRGKVVLVFSLPSQAISFLKENSWQDFPVLPCLILERPGKFRPEAQSAMDSASIRIFQPNELKLCFDECRNFLLDETNADTVIDGLEFSAAKKD